MKKLKYDDGVFQGERVISTTPEESQSAFEEMVKQFKSAHATWIDDVRRDAENMLAFVDEHGCSKTDLWLVKQLLADIANYQMATYPEWAAFLIGQRFADALRLPPSFDS